MVVTNVASIPEGAILTVREVLGKQRRVEGSVFDPGRDLSKTGRSHIANETGELSA
jgi:hypothetical protein